jgi:YhcN/YlaJ family sporulation lipoprotein
MKLKLMGVALATTVALAGCGITNNDDGTATRDGAADNNTNVEKTRYNDRADNNRINNRNMTNTRYNENRDGAKNNERYDVSKEAADKITAEVNDVDRAYVLTTKNNAYVGVVMHDKDNNNRTDRNNNDDRNGLTNHDGVNNTGDLNRKDDGTRNMADRTNDHDVTDHVKKQVTDAVKSVDNKIDHVYVTTNPDFVDLTTDYADEARNGHPIGGFFDQIGDMIQRVFPTGHR